MALEKSLKLTLKTGKAVAKGVQKTAKKGRSGSTKVNKRKYTLKNASVFALKAAIATLKVIIKFLRAFSFVLSLIVLMLMVLYVLIFIVGLILLMVIAVLGGFLVGVIFPTLNGDNTDSTPEPTSQAIVMIKEDWI